MSDAAFVLYGGTAIALYLGHRNSVDFDCFTDRPFEPDDLVTRFPFLRDAEFLQTKRDTLTVLVGQDDRRVKISFFGGLGLGRLSDPRRTPDGAIDVATLQDLLAHKLKVIPQRVEVRDYLDIDALLQNGQDLADGCGGARALFTAFAPSECLKALTYFNDPSLRLLSLPVKQRLIAAVAAVQAIPQLTVKSNLLSMR